jgi:hypothetical protein
MEVMLLILKPGHQGSAFGSALDQAILVERELDSTPRGLFESQPATICVPPGQLTPPCARSVVQPAPPRIARNISAPMVALA